MAVSVTSILPTRSIWSWCGCSAAVALSRRGLDCGLFSSSGEATSPKRDALCNGRTAS
jgi:hypothetical protein